MMTMMMMTMTTMTTTHNDGDVSQCLSVAAVVLPNLLDRPKL